ncbi:TetR family transcriptional regulator [Gleimia sp. 6138-11-ORH1]|uniref:TetR/AcrR family transcriptional regulator n=1 Tax=Gleimia sp. 6138-11-ORH1 TaxID=2973937 RepID=UPI00216A0B1E|nr:TetR family transcriptional regulator [Gleimia sp. 6138-11-ORH1]MCS4484606.1 TetR family transcriptional regulator [Gleimia sp. 6138-11-ORH1]
MSDRLETEQRLIEATKRIMVTHGVEGCTLERITEAAGFTRGAFYSNFRSKEELFVAVAEDEYAIGIRRIKQFGEQWAGHMADHPLPKPLTTEISAYIFADALRKFLAHMELNREFFILHSEFMIRSARVPDWAALFAEINRQFVLALGEVLNVIVDSLGLQLTHSAEALSQAVIGIVLRANGVASWEQIQAQATLNTTTKKHFSSSIAIEVTELIVPLLLGCTKPQTAE